tara:strand:+ start:688 stop:981 length:294 start_codon:yes stop_codon:yes gene_type:complete
MEQLDIEFPKPPTGVLEQLDLPFPVVVLSKDDVRVSEPYWDWETGEDTISYNNHEFDLNVKLPIFLANDFEDAHQFIVECFNEELVLRKAIGHTEKE